MTPSHRRGLIALALVILVGACTTADDPAAAPSTSAPPGSTTTVEPRNEEVSGFVAFGDSGGGPAQDDVAAAVARWAVDHRIDALVTTGDNVYNHGEPDLFDDQLDVPYAALREDRPLWVTLGNHDVERGYGDEQLDYLGLPDLPYAKELPGVQILFLDGNRLDGEQLDWLDQRLGAEGPDLRVVVLHQPPYACSVRGGVPVVRDLLVPVVERHDVALVLSGHEHLYQRFISPDGVTYVVTGGGGKSLYEYREPCEVASMLKARAEVFHFVGVEVRGDVLTATAVSADGAVLDRFEIRH